MRKWLPVRASAAPPTDRKAIMRRQARRAKPHLDVARHRIETAAAQTTGTDWRLELAAQAVDRRMEHSHAILAAALDAALSPRPAPRPAASSRTATAPAAPRPDPQPTWADRVRAAGPAPEPLRPPKPAAGAAEAADRVRRRVRENREGGER